MPATRIDLRPGDVLSAVEEREITTLDDLARAIIGHHVGDVVTLVIRRQGEELVRPIIFDNEPSPWAALLPRAMGE